jgi:hypothetical protein
MKSGGLTPGRRPFLEKDGAFLTPSGSGDLSIGRDFRFAGGPFRTRPRGTQVSCHAKHAGREARKLKSQ